MRPSPTLTVSFSEFVCVSLERFARESPFRQRLHQFGVIEQLHQLGDRFVGRRVLSGEVARDDRLRLEDRIDENVVAHDLLVPHGLTVRTAPAPIIRHLLNGASRAQWLAPSAA
jgi:hypothetical protein